MSAFHLADSFCQLYVICDRSGQLAGGLVQNADARIIVQIADPYIAVLCKQFFFFAGQECAGLCGKAALIKLIRVKRVIIPNPTHGAVQRVLDVRTAFADRKIDIRPSNVCHRSNIKLTPAGLFYGDKAAVSMKYSPVPWGMVHAHTLQIILFADVCLCPQIVVPHYIPVKFRLQWYLR